MTKKLIYLIQERPRNLAARWHASEAFENELDAITFRDTAQKENSDYEFKLTQLPFTTKDK